MTMERYFDRLEVTVAYNELYRLESHARAATKGAATVRVTRMAINALIVANRGEQDTWKPEHIRKGQVQLLGVLSGFPDCEGDRGIMPRVDA